MQLDGRLTNCTVLALNCKLKTQSSYPCRSAEVKIFSVFLCQRCREIWREIFCAKFSRVWVCDGKFHQNFTSKTVWKTENFTQISLCWGAALIKTVASFPLRRCTESVSLSVSISFGRGEKTPTPKISALLRKRPVLLRANFFLTKDRKRPYYGHFCGKIHREGSCSKAVGGSLVKSRC